MTAAAGITIARGFAPSERAAVADLFWQAFAGKLGRVLGPKARALDYLDRAIHPPNALCARDSTGRVVGLAGLKTRAGGLIGGDAATLAAVYGWLGTAWRAPLLNMTDKPLADGQISLDGLCVAADRRGAGIGAALIAGVVAEARELDLREVWLEVVDTNPRARQLYLRAGFVPAGSTALGPLRHVFGFRMSEAMVLSLCP